VTEPNPETGFLDKPIFVRGGLPATGQGRQYKSTTRWEPHFEMGRQYPAWPDGRKPPDGYEVDPQRGWMIVSRVTRGGKQATLKAIMHDRNQIQAWLDRRCPLERWQMAMRIIPDTWAQRELYLRFLGTLTPEEDALDRKERSERHQVRMARGKEAKAKRMLEARLAARAEQEANQAKARRRR
jgi:hypothetical protein